MDSITRNIPTLPKILLCFFCISWYLPVTPNHILVKDGRKDLHLLLAELGWNMHGDL